MKLKKLAIVLALSALGALQALTPAFALTPGFEFGSAVKEGAAVYYNFEGALLKYDEAEKTSAPLGADYSPCLIKSFGTGEVMAARTSEIGFGPSPEKVKFVRLADAGVSARPVAAASFDDRVLIAGVLSLCEYDRKAASFKPVDIARIGRFSQIFRILPARGGAALVTDRNISLYDFASKSVTAVLKISEGKNDFTIEDACSGDSGEIIAMTDRSICRVAADLSKFEKMALPSSFGAVFPPRPAAADNFNGPSGRPMVYYQNGTLFIYRNGAFYLAETDALSEVRKVPRAVEAPSVSGGALKTECFPPSAAQISPDKAVFITDWSISIYDFKSRNFTRVEKPAGMIGSAGISGNALYFSIGDGLFVSDVAAGPGASELSAAASCALISMKGAGTGDEVLAETSRGLCLKTGQDIIVVDRQGASAASLRAGASDQYFDYSRNSAKRVSTCEIGFISAAPSACSLVTFDLSKMERAEKKIAGFFPRDFVNSSGLIYFIASQAAPAAGEVRFSGAVRPGTKAERPAPATAIAAGKADWPSYYSDAGGGDTSPVISGGFEGVVKIEAGMTEKQIGEAREKAFRTAADSSAYLVARFDTARSFAGSELLKFVPFKDSRCLLVYGKPEMKKYEAAALSLPASGPFAITGRFPFAAVYSHVSAAGVLAVTEAAGKRKFFEFDGGFENMKEISGRLSAKGIDPSAAMVFETPAGPAYVAADHGNGDSLAFYGRDLSKIGLNTGIYSPRGVLKILHASRESVYCLVGDRLYRLAVGGKE